MDNFPIINRQSNTGILSLRGLMGALAKENGFSVLLKKSLNQKQTPQFHRFRRFHSSCQD